jgi:radical SAM protein with 4Fe4S-binding SPASM domain
VSEVTGGNDIAAANRPGPTFIEPHHVLENILQKRWLQILLGRMTDCRPGAQSLFERLCANYRNPALTGWDRIKWGVPSKIIDRVLERRHSDKELWTRKLFHHPPTVKALNLTMRSIARYGLTAPQRYVAPLFIVWNFTQACNLRCRHCYQAATAQPEADELTLPEKLDLVDQMADAGVTFLAVSGGEPLMSDHLWPVLAHAAKRGIHLTVATNGTLLKPETIARLRECRVKYVEVSIDHMSAREHDSFRGQPGSWARAVAGIRNSVSGGMKTGLAATLTRETAHLVDEMVDFTVSLGCKTFSHFNFIPVGRGRDMFERDLNPDEREILLSKLVRHLQENRVTVLSTAPQFGRACIEYGAADGLFATGHAGRGKGAKTRVLSRYIGGCGSGRCYCAIEPDGTVTPCVYISSLPVGHVRRQRLIDIWNNPLFQGLSDRDNLHDHCRVCPYRSYCGGCRARALAYRGSIHAGDPGCIRNAAAPELSAARI